MTRAGDKLYGDWNRANAKRPVDRITRRNNLILAAAQVVAIVVLVWAGK